MFTELYRVEGSWPGRLAISARPRGGDWLEEEMRAWRRAGIDVVVSLLEPDESDELGLAGERRASEANGLDFLSFPIADRGVPSSDEDVRTLLSEIDSRLRRGENIAIHCRQGVGRAGLIAATLLVERGLSSGEAVQRVSAARGVPIPETVEQRRWIEAFAATPTPKL